MPTIWDASLSVGVVKLDDQHRRWIQLCNSLHDALSQGKGNNVIGDTLREVVHYTRTHFRDEEQLLQASRFPGFNAHKALHDQFVKEIDELLKAHANGVRVVSVLAATKLSTWLVQHIKAADQAYSAHLAAHAKTTGLRL